MKKFTLKTSVFVSLLSAAAYLLSPSILAQESQEEVDKEDSEDAVELSVFEVESERDYGYRVTNSISASGFGTEIAKLPFSVGVVTDDLIEDTQALELKDVIGRVSGVNAAHMNADNTRIRVRAYRPAVLRDGASMPQGAFAINNAERIEVLKGPASVFYGLVSPGGVINVITDKPKFYNTGSLSLTYGSYDFTEVVFKSSGPLYKDKVAYHVNYTDRDSDTWQDNGFFEEQFFAASLLIQPTSKLQWLIEFEDLDRNGNPASMLTLTHPAFDAADADSAPPSMTARQWVNANLNPDEPAEQIDITGVFYPGGHRYNGNGPEGIDEEKSQTLSSTVEWRIADGLTFKNTVNHRLLQPSLAIYFLNFRPSGQRTIFDRFWADARAHDRFFVESEIVLETHMFGESQKFLFGHEYNSQKTWRGFFPSTKSSFDPFVDAPRLGMQELLADGFDKADFLSPDPSAFGDVETNYVYGFTQLGFLKDRLRIVTGARFADNEQNGATTKKVTPQIGVSFDIVPGFSIYGNYSRSFQPSGSIDAFGQVVPPQLGKGYEIGAKYDLFDSKISGSFAFFSLKRADIARRDFTQERDLDIMPIFLLDQEEKVEGIEFDLFYTPRRDLQVTVAYSYTWDALNTNSPNDLRQQGLRLDGVPEHVFDVWGKYTFTEGPVKGLYVGAGFKVSDSFRTHPNWSVTFEADSYITVDLLFGYKTVINEIPFDISVKIKNANDEFYYANTFTVADPASVFVTARINW